MMDWNRKYPVECKLPQTVYAEVIAVVRNYDYIKSVHTSIIEGGAVLSDGMPKGSGIGNPTESRAIKAERYHDRLKAIEEPISLVPSQYQRQVWENCIHKVPFPEQGRRTFGRWKQAYLYEVARRLYLI